MPSGIHLFNISISELEEHECQSVPSASNTESCPGQTYSLLLGGLEMGYFGVDLPLGQDAASMPPPTTARNAPAQAMKMADPNSYLDKRDSESVKRVGQTSAELHII